MEKSEVQKLLDQFARTTEQLIEATKALELYKSDHALFAIHVDKMQNNLERLQQVTAQIQTML